MSDPDGPDGRPTGEHEDRPEIDVDALFAAIVADFARPAPRGGGPWPASEDLDDEPPADGGASGPAPGDGGEAPARRIVLPSGPPPAPDRDVVEGVVDDEDDEDDDGFVPPEPGPFPRGDRLSRAAWTAVIGGPLFLLVAALTWRTLPSVLLLLALVAFVGGFVTLVARMPAEPPDDPDDGAVV
jgi:hypothetical protein